MSTQVTSTLPAHAVPNTAMSDRELVHLAQRGERIGFELLARRYQDRLFRTVLLYVGSTPTAEDIVQDALIKAFCNIGQFRGDSQFFSWVLRIAINRRRNYFDARQSSMDEIGFSVDAVSPNSDSPERRMEVAELRSAVWSALARLDPEHRLILILREFDGYDYRTIADLLNLKMGTVRSRLCRARGRMRVELKAFIQS